MAPTLIVLGLLALGVAIVALATHRPGGRPPAAGDDQNTTWTDPGPDQAPPEQPPPEPPEPRS
ncbi:MAG: hypothetical protein Q8S03_06445 [Brevundimonas sp.]|uniref:hypothetical protein n=1 Tax=Brevundimonas sp. TaxID=1871086 RepID=UPI00273600EB|nr:hypothetical protein [Brevundimonas sp.]MDP3404312.1 hypothetical protein [Brevundimonas sp.]